MSVEKRLLELGVNLPIPATPIANYVGYVLSGSQLVISGQLAFDEHGRLAPEHIGKLGTDVLPAAGTEAAKRCAINLLAQAKAALGSLDRIERCVRLGGFINAAPDFTTLPAIMNGASDLMVAVLGDKGRHARSTVGVASLPLNCAVEVEAIFEVK